MDPRDLFGWNRGANKDAAQRARDTGEPVELNWYETLMGGSAEDAQNINKRLKQKELNNQLGSKAAEYGVSGADWGENQQTYLKRIHAARNKKIDKDKETTHKRDKDIITANNAVGMAGVNATREGTNAQLEMARMENASRDKRYYADRIDAREARADELMFRRESMERADRKDDKNRRRESIQALVAGLSSLGAAFAV